MIEDEYVTKCVIDPCTRSISIYSNLGKDRKISCDSIDEFMNVLSYIRDCFEENLIDAELIYASPMVLS